MIITLDTLIGMTFSICMGPHPLSLDSPAPIAGVEGTLRKT
ncbi:MAG TPA: hypothetical protein VFK14_12480 [Solirubrobacterales bacterium]|nr:hypothetical protein [Solirubrobacterales bacterium]